MVVLTVALAPLFGLALLPLVASHPPDSRAPKKRSLLMLNPNQVWVLTQLSWGHSLLNTGARIHVKASKWILMAPNYPKRHLYKISGLSKASFIGTVEPKQSQNNPRQNNPK